MEIEIHLWNKGLADGYYAVRAEGCTAAALFWGDNQGELKQYSAFAYILLDTKGEGNFKFTGGRAIPREAQGVYVRAGTPDGDGFCGGSYEGYEKIPEEFRPALLLEDECVKMRVGLMSDLHMTDKPVFTVAGNHDITEKTGENYYRFWEKLWKRTEKAFPETERRIDGFAVTLGPGMDLIGLTLCYKNKAFYFSEPESTLRWLDQYLTKRRGNCHLLMCHAPLLHHNPQRKPQKHSPYLTRDQAVQGIVTRAGGVIFLSGHTHISPNTPEGCAKWDPIHKNIYINDGSVCPCELKTKENGWPSEWSDGCVTELIFYEKWVEVVMRFLRSGKRISRGQYRFPLSDVCQGRTSMRRKQENRYKISIEKELKLAERQEDALRRAAVKQEVPRWRTALEEKVPEKIYGNLKKAFCKAFQIVFEKGGGIIEKTYDRESIREDQEIRAFAFQVKGDRKSLKNIRKDANASNLRNMAVTSLEGIGLGALGIGLPDIVLFVGILLKGIYEISLRYGYDYTLDGERYFILKLMEGAMQKGDAWEACSREVDHLAAAGQDLTGTPEAVRDQIPHTAEAFAADMVVLKFIQGLPVVGILGGAGNPVYYRRVMKYAELKYRRRYLLELQKCVESAQEGMGE